MSLPHFPSFSIARCTLKKLNEAEIIDIAIQKQKLEEWKLDHEKLLLSVARDMYRELTNGWSRHEREHWNDHLDELKQYRPVLVEFLKQFPTSKLTAEKKKELLKE